MARKCYKPEEIVPLLRQAEVLHGHNHTSSRCRQRWLRDTRGDSVFLVGGSGSHVESLLYCANLL